MKRDRIALIAVVFIAILAVPLFANGTKEQVTNTVTPVEKSVVVNIGQEPTTLDPGLNAGVDGTLVLTHTYEGLVRFDEGKIIPGIAKSWDVSDDGLVYTFHLRDTGWADGTPVTAQDFEFGWKRALDPEVASSYSWIFQSANVSSFRTVDDKTFEVTLAVSAGPVFLQCLCNTTFLPIRGDKCDYLHGSWALDPETAISNGAFYMTEYKSGDRLILEPNPYYYDKENVNLDSMTFMMIVDQTTALTGFESGEIDALTAVPPTSIPRLINENPDFMVFPANGENYYAFHVTVEGLDDVRVRKALSYSINRKAIVEDVLKDGSQVAYTLVPNVILSPDGSTFNDNVGTYGLPTADEKYGEAKELLAQAGYPDGEGFPELSILYNTNETNKAVAEAIQQMWNTNLGIHVALTNMESAVFHQTRVAHNMDICRGGWWGDYFDPLTHLELYKSDMFGNYAEWISPEYDKLIEEAVVLDGEERFDKFYEADKLLEESYAYMPISYSVNMCLVDNDKITDWQMTPNGTLDFTRSDITE